MLNIPYSYFDNYRFGFLAEKKLLSLAGVNSCRYLPVSQDVLGRNVDAPYCFIDDNYGSFTIEECNVRQCGELRIYTPCC